MSDRVVTLALVLVFTVAVAPSASAEELAVVITSPVAGEAIFGPTELAADVLGAAAEQIVRVEFFVDGRFVGERREPPWQLEWDVGEENAAHRFEVVAESRDGRRASALVVSRRIAVDLELEAALQQLYVTVERDGERILDLERGDFTVIDDGRPERLVTFERGDVPLTAVLLVDASDSMRGASLRAALAGAGAFIDRMQPLDQARLLLFSDHVVHETPFTSVAEVLRTGLGRVRAGGGTALVDHLFLALESLEEREGRRVVLVLSDGVDVSSLLRMDEVAATLRRSSAMLYWLRLGGDAPNRRHYSAWHDAAEHRRQLDLLAAAARESGGRVVDLADPTGAADAFLRILSELREQYVLGYYPSRDLGDGAWHPVRVDVDRRGVEIRTRDGYIDR